MARAVALRSFFGQRLGKSRLGIPKGERLDLVVLSGDLTLAAREEEFEKARAFIAALKAPTLSVPGNHDITPYHLVERFVAPYRRWREFIGAELEPSWSNGTAAVVGINTARRMRFRLDWSHGSVSRGQLRALSPRFAALGACPFRIVVAHHPLEHLPGEKKKRMRGADEAMEELARLNADVVLSGHLHSWRADPFAEKPGRNAVLQVHAGTGLSTRLRGQDNDFNLLEIEDGLIDVTRYATAEGDDRFAMAQTRRFVIRPQGWTSHKEG